MGLEEAYASAREKLAVLRETGDNPVRHQALKEQREGLRDATLADCFQVYLEDLTRRWLQRRPSPQASKQ